MLKVLIVDDHAEIRRLLRHTLEGIYELLEAENADIAEGLIRKQRPRAVLLDVMMPGSMNGYQLCEKIKNDPELSSTYICLLTARGQESDLERGRQVGADDYLVKPFSPLELIKHLEQSLND